MVSKCVLSRLYRSVLRPMKLLSEVVELCNLFLRSCIVKLDAVIDMVHRYVSASCKSTRRGKLSLHLVDCRDDFIWACIHHQHHLDSSLLGSKQERLSRLRLELFRFCARAFSLIHFGLPQSIDPELSIRTPELFLMGEDIIQSIH